MTIGNLPKRVRRAYSRHAYVLVAYFPILKSTGRDDSKAAFTEAKRVLYQNTMRMILNHLTEATTRYLYLMYHFMYYLKYHLYSIIDVPGVFHSFYRGEFWKGPDSRTRKCFPVITSFQVDYPESCNLTLVRTNYACPICTACKEDFGSILGHTVKKTQARTVEKMRAIYQEAQVMIRQNDAKGAEDLLRTNGLVNTEVGTIQLGFLLLVLDRF